MDLELKAESSGATLFGKSVSELQTNVSVSGKNITGTLNYVTGYTGFSSNPEEQEGHFLALDLSDNDFTGLTSVMVGLDPSAGSGLVEIINDPDKNGVFRISNTRQKFKIVSTDGTYTKTQVFNLSGLTLAEEVSG